jgi:hypothetical protein
MCEKTLLEQYIERTQHLEASGAKMLAYNCPYESCGKEIRDVAAEPGQSREPLSVCPHCERLYKKLVTHDSVSTVLPAHVAAKNVPTTVSTGPLGMPLPDPCTDLYAAGWAFADAFIAKGGSVDAEADASWNEEKAVGFWDRLAAERKHRASIAERQYA